MTNEEYGRLVGKLSNPSPMGKDLAWAFLVGGGISALGQALLNGYQRLGMEKDEASTAVSVTLIFLAVLFTGLGWFDKLAKHAGAGTLVPHHRLCQRRGRPRPGVPLRGAGHRRGGQAFRHRRAGAGIWDLRQRGLRPDPGPVRRIDHGPVTRW